MADGETLRVGEPAPDFSLPSSTGEMVKLSDFRSKSAVVLFFYPKDNSPACTMEACSFRDSHEAFREAGAAVIGISADSEKSHRGFAERFRLPYLLLADRDGAVRRGTACPKHSACSRAASATSSTARGSSVISSRRSSSPGDMSPRRWRSSRRSEIADSG